MEKSYNDAGDQLLNCIKMRDKIWEENKRLQKEKNNMAWLVEEKEKPFEELIDIVDKGYDESVFVSWRKVVELVERIKNARKRFKRI